MDLDVVQRISMPAPATVAEFPEDAEGAYVHPILFRVYPHFQVVDALQQHVDVE